MRKRPRRSQLFSLAACAIGIAFVFALRPSASTPDQAEPALGDRLILAANAADDAKQDAATKDTKDTKDAKAGGAEVDFAREVLPILSNHCFLCHGPDQDSKEAKKAGFRLDLREEAVDFEMIIPGNADESPVIDVLTTTKASRKMPPLDSVKPQLTAKQVDTLRRWIDQGANYTEHWSFEKPTKPQLPELPATADPDWSRHDMDVFIQAKLAEKGLKPNAPADKHRLIRRVYLDLIGLPPTPEQTAAFIDDASPAAYEKVVDELLASPHFGEHWTRQWLDKARYADSQGYEKDRRRTMYRYRDWVIHAINADMPFDQFTLEQIAGDLLPKPTLDQLIATGFHRNTMTNTEGGTDDEEFRAAAVIDRVNTTMEVWMGVTMGCAQCHTHKYDPIFHDEYFQIYAFFNQTEDADRYNDAPFVSAPVPEQKEERDRLQKLVDAAKKAVAAAKPAPAPEPAPDTKKQDKNADATKDGDKAKEAPKPEPTPEQKRLVDLEKQLANLNRQIPNALVMKDLSADKQRKTYLFKGGSFLAPDKEGGIIEPGVPKALHPMPEDAPKNRLGLAKWLVDADNPLTARVQVNRIWEQIWGIGLVQTTNDFGFQGSYPSNKALLDHLAVAYQHEMKWSTKSLIKRIVTSSAYRQSARQTAAMREVDPFNQFMSRGPRLRLSAEQVRDQALAVAGILVTDRIGGPSVTPYMPKGLLPQAFDGYVQKQSQGDDLYRRGVYTAWRRTAHYASFAAFDAPSREICTIMRSRTNTPMQAFVTLNDPVFVEAAQMLARRIINEAGDDLDARITLGVNLALAREPSANERKTLRKVYEESLAEYKNKPQEAIKMAVGPAVPLPAGMDAADAAAMTLVGNVLLNLDEVINKP